MSATNRGSKRIESDRYYTPENVIHNFLSKYNMDMDRLVILEPAAGQGNICKVIKELYPRSYIVANEIEDKYYELKKYADHVYNNDFLKMDKHEYIYDVIISNPPFSKAREFIEECFEVANKDTTIIMLLRTAFLESKSRYDFWQKYPLSGLYTLSSRPSFTNNGKSDSTSYSFFIWQLNSDKQTIKVI